MAVQTRRTSNLQVNLYNNNNKNKTRTNFNIWILLSQDSIGLDEAKKFTSNFKHLNINLRWFIHLFWIYNSNFGSNLSLQPEATYSILYKFIIYEYKQTGVCVCVSYKFLFWSQLFDKMNLYILGISINRKISQSFQQTTVNFCSAACIQYTFIQNPLELMTINLLAFDRCVIVTWVSHLWPCYNFYCFDPHL